MVVAFALQLVLALALLAVGRWGMANADRLVPAGLDEEETSSRRGSYRRGAGACIGLGVLFVLFAFLTLFA